MKHATDSPAPGGQTRRSKASSSPAARHVLARFTYWLPVAIPLGLFAQIALFGLRPALAEREHLARMRVEVETRHEQDMELYDELGRRYRARHDPVFRERQRRLAQGPWVTR